MGLRVLITFEGGGEAAGVGEAQGQRIYLRLAEQRSEPAPGVAGWLDGEFHQAIGGTVHQPVSGQAVHAPRRLPAQGRVLADGTNRTPGYVQLESRAHPDPD